MSGRSTPLKVATRCRARSSAIAERGLVQPAIEERRSPSAKKRQADHEQQADPGSATAEVLVWMKCSTVPVHAGLQKRTTSRAYSATAA